MAQPEPPLALDEFPGDGPPLLTAAGHPHIEKAPGRVVLHQLIDALPDVATVEAKRMHRVLMTQDPVRQAALAATLGGETETAEEACGVAEARTAAADGRVASHAEVRSRILDKP